MPIPRAFFILSSFLSLNSFIEFVQAFIFCRNTFSIISPFFFSFANTWSTNAEGRENQKGPALSNEHNFFVPFSLFTLKEKHLPISFPITWNEFDNPDLKSTALKTVFNKSLKKYFWAILMMITNVPVYYAPTVISNDVLQSSYFYYCSLLAGVQHLFYNVLHFELRTLPLLNNIFGVCSVLPLRYLLVIVLS